MSFGAPKPATAGFTMASAPVSASSSASQLRQWPVQLHLLNPEAAYFRSADVVLAADCVAFSFADFHNRFLAGKTLAIACPKLDTNKEAYVEKLKAMIILGNQYTYSHYYGSSMLWWIAGAGSKSCGRSRTKNSFETGSHRHQRRCTERRMDLIN
jgi:hypothetical protein